jgi:hypothetical protein
MRIGIVLMPIQIWIGINMEIRIRIWIGINTMPTQYNIGQLALGSLSDVKMPVTLLVFHFTKRYRTVAVRN